MDSKSTKPSLELNKAKKEKNNQNLYKTPRAHNLYKQPRTKNLYELRYLYHLYELPRTHTVFFYLLCAFYIFAIMISIEAYRSCIGSFAFTAQMSIKSILNP